MAIGGYSIYDYWWILWLLIVINGYDINAYRWLFY
jgi:hypothetical protein